MIPKAYDKNPGYIADSILALKYWCWEDPKYSVMTWYYWSNQDLEVEHKRPPTKATAEEDVDRVNLRIPRSET